MSAATKSVIARVLVGAGVVALAAGAILSLPRPSAAARAPLDVVLVDVSKSVVGRAAGEWGGRTTSRLTEIAARAESSGRDVAVVAFGRDVRTAFAAQPGRALRAVLADKSFDPERALLEPGGRSGATETRLAAALRLARTLLDERTGGAIMLLGDGTYTGEDPSRTARELASAGSAITLVSEPARAWNLALGPLEVARELEAGAPIVVTTSVRVDRGRLAGGGHARLDCEVRDAGGVRTQRVAFETGAQDVISLHVDLGAAKPGLVRIEARVSFASGVPDALPEDDRSSAVVRCGGSLVVGRVGAAASSTPWQASGIEIVALERADLAANLAKLDAVVTSDIRLAPDEQRALRSFVEHGGGWLDLAGPEWIRERRRTSEPVHALAALAPDAGAEKPRDVVFLLDASGSMAGPPFDAVRARIGALVDSALPRDDVSVRFFAEDLSPPIRFGDGAERSDPARRPALDEAVRTSRAAAGSTRILAALERVAAERAGAQRDTLVLLLSDGREPLTPDRDARLARIREQRPASRTRVVAVAPVADVDEEFLARVADAFVDLADPLLWPTVFEREIVERDVARRSRTPVIPVTGGSEPAASLAAATPNLPTIDAAARAEATAGAQVLWTDDRGAPLAAFARRGAGRVVSLAFTPGSDWAPSWTAEPLAPLLRALARSERSTRPGLRLEGDVLVLENVPAGFSASARAAIRLDDGGSIACTFDADARGFDPRTTRTSPVPPGLDEASGFAFVHVDGGSAGDLDLALERPRAGELAFEPRRFVPPEPGPLAARAGGGRGAHPLAVPCLLAGLCALAAAALMGAFSARRG